MRLNQYLGFIYRQQSIFYCILTCDSNHNTETLNYVI